MTVTVPTGISGYPCRRNGKRKQKGTRKGESVAERRARQATVAARHGRDIDKRERARAGKRGLGGLRASGGRGRGRTR